MVARRCGLLVLLAVAGGCRSLPPGAETRSLDGRPLYPPPLPPKVREQRQRELIEARALYREHPGDLQAVIWYGRRLAYLGRYREAVAVYTEGLERHPDSPELYRHRGHRYITLRRFDDAVADLERARRLIRGTADAVEPDGIPNARAEPRSTLHFNVHYHLGLARYLLGEFEPATAAYREAVAVARNADTLCAASHWLYTALRRLGRDKEAAAVLAPIHDGMDIIENHAYYKLLLLYRGELTPELVMGGDDSRGAAATYGVARWHIAEGRRQRGRELLLELVRQEQWAAFGVIAAEADLYLRDEFGDAVIAASQPPRRLKSSG